MSTPTLYIHKQRYIPPAIKVREIKYGRLLEPGSDGEATGSDGYSGDGETGNPEIIEDNNSKDFILQWSDPWDEEY